MVTSLHLNSFLTPQGGKGEGPAGGVLSRAERQRERDQSFYYVQKFNNVSCGSDSFCQTTSPFFQGQLGLSPQTRDFIIFSESQIPLRVQSEHMNLLLRRDAHMHMLTHFDSFKGFMHSLSPSLAPKLQTPALGPGMGEGPRSLNNSTQP